MFRRCVNGHATEIEREKGLMVYVFVQGGREGAKGLYEFGFRGANRLAAVWVARALIDGRCTKRCATSVQRCRMLSWVFRQKCRQCEWHDLGQEFLNGRCDVVSWTIPRHRMVFDAMRCDRHSPIKMRRKAEFLMRLAQSV